MMTARQKARWRKIVRLASDAALTTWRVEIMREFVRCADDWEAGRWDAGIHAERLTEILTKLYSTVGSLFARIGRDMVSEQQENRAAPEARSDVYFGDRVAQLVRTYGPERARKIAAKSQAILTELLARAAREGLSEAQTARLIRKELTTERLSLARARTIARTEIGAAQNSGMLAAADQIAGRVLKTWVAIHDGRTRLTHSVVDGKTIGPGEKFTVGDAQLEHPGDPAGLPQETINCRCTMLLEYAP